MDARAFGRGTGDMSNRLKVGCVFLAIVGVAIWYSTAAAQTGGSDGGNTVTIGVSTSSTWPGLPGHPGTAARGGSGDTSKVQCTDVPLPDAQSAVLGSGGPTPGMWYLVKCPNQPGTANVEHLVWVPAGSVAAPATGTVGADAGAVAARAAASIVLPSPTIQLNPATFSVVNLQSWLAIDPALWRPFTAAATAGGVSVTAQASPTSVTWNMGDGGVVVCDGPGTRYDPTLPESAQTPSCAYTYQRSSEGQTSSDGNPNDGAFQVTATVTWTVTWAALGEPGGGTLPSLQTSSTAPVRVEQVESVGVGQ